MRLYIVGGFFVMLAFMVYAVDSDELRITQNPKNQQNPAIYGDIVVWQDYRYGDWDIYGYNLSTGEEFQITENSENQQNPAIYRDIVVWQEEPSKYRYSASYGSNIYGYIISKKRKLSIVVKSYCNSMNPVIYEDIVVWEDDRVYSLDIYYYAVVREEEFRITEAPKDQQNPAIYGDIVVWQDYRNDNWDIYGYNLSTGEEFQITENSHMQRSPAIYGDTVVWEDYRNGNWDIYSFKFASSHETLVDRDNDGVPDNEDGCYNPDCAITDSEGCPKDSDGDGLNDCKDDCPTEFGTRDSNGCSASDRDNDGVPDNEDGCYNPDCAIIDSGGCPKDSDGDGLNDCKDDCPIEFGARDSNGCQILILEIWNFIVQHRLSIALSIYVSDVLYNLREYLKARKKGLSLPLVKVLLLVLGSFPLFIDLLHPKK